MFKKSILFVMLFISTCTLSAEYKNGNGDINESQIEKMFKTILVENMGARDFLAKAGIKSNEIENVIDRLVKNDDVRNSILFELQRAECGGKSEFYKSDAILSSTRIAMIEFLGAAAALAAMVTYKCSWCSKLMNPSSEQTISFARKLFNAASTITTVGYGALRAYRWLDLFKNTYGFYDSSHTLNMMEEVKPSMDEKLENAIIVEIKRAKAKADAGASVSIDNL